MKVPTVSPGFFAQADQGNPTGGPVEAKSWREPMGKRELTIEIKRLQNGIVFLLDLVLE